MTPLGWGVIASIVIVIVVATVVVIGKLPINQTAYTAEFEQAAQLRVGDRAVIAGITVGNVDALRLAGDHVVVDFHVRDDVDLGDATRAEIKLTSILGSRYLELRPAGDNALADHRIPLSQTAVPYNLQQTLEDSTTTFNEIDADRITESLTALSAGLDGVPEALPQALANVRSLSQVIGDRRKQITSLLASSDAVTTLIRNQQSDIAALMVQGRDLMDQVVSRRDAVEKLLASTTNLVNRLNRVSTDEPALVELLGNMEELSSLLANHDALLRSTLQMAPVTVRNLTNATGSGNAMNASAPAGPFVDSWMCAISGRAKQFNLTEYFQDCEPSADPWPGWPPPQPERVP